MRAADACIHARRPVHHVPDACMCPWCRTVCMLQEHGTTLGPMKVEAPEVSKDYYVCMCGHSQKRPFCDGSHSSVHEAI